MADKDPGLDAKTGDVGGISRKSQVHFVFLGNIGSRVDDIYIETIERNYAIIIY